MWDFLKKIVLRRYSLQRTKIILVSLFLPALLFDFSFEINLKDFKDFYFKFIQGNAIENSQFLSLVLIFGILIFVDFANNRREQKIIKKYLEILQDKDISDEVKIELIKKLPK